MGVSQVNYNGETLVDLTNDTVSEETLLSGYTAHAANGEQIVGKAIIPTKTSQLENDSGFITDIAIPELINTALAQAKASGEFDGKDAYTPVKGKDFWTSSEVAEIVQSAVKETLKIIAPYSIKFGEGRLYAPATSASYSATSVSDNSLTFQYRGGSGVEELAFPITGLSAGRIYTIDFDETYNGGFIQDTYRYGCGIIQKSVYDSTSFPTQNAKPSYIAWHTGSTGTQSGKITFTAESDTVYWVWSLGRLSDGVNVTITFNARVY